LSNKSSFKKVIPPLVTLLIGIFIFIIIPYQISLPETESSIVRPTNARTIPYLITTGVILLSILEFVSGMIKLKRSNEEVQIDRQTKNLNYIGVCGALIAMLLWLLLIPYVGFNISTILLTITMMLIIGNRKWWQIVLLSLILSYPLDYVLKVVLRVYLPQGIFFE